MTTPLHIRVIAPSTSGSVIPKHIIEHACARLQSVGCTVSFGDHVYDTGPLGHATIKQRLTDLHDAVADTDVDIVWSIRGGFSVNQLLPFIDFDLIAAHPKLYCGSSDITALINAIYAKTGVTSLLVPSVSHFGMQRGLKYTLDSVCRFLEQAYPITYVPSKQWSDDNWVKHPDKRIFLKNNGPYIITPGSATGHAIGGNLCTFNLLHGTPYMPELAGSILIIEDDALVQGTHFAPEFDRNLESLLQQPGADKIRAVVFGRFQKKSKMTKQKLRTIVDSKPLLQKIPVIAGFDVGHTSPSFPIPIGRTVTLTATKRISFVCH